VRERNGVVLPIDRELNPLEVKELAVHDVHRGVHNGLPDAAGEPVNASPLLVSLEITEGFQGVRVGLL